MRDKKAFKSTTFIVILLAICISCSKSPSNKIIGTWECVEEHFTDGSPCYDLLGCTWSFSEDKMYWSGPGWASSVQDYSLIDNKFLSIHFHNMGDYSFNYEIQDLTNKKLIVKKGSEISTFKKQ